MILKKLRQPVYLLAAEKIHSGYERYSCCAIENSGNVQLKRFVEFLMFRPGKLKGCESVSWFPLSEAKKEGYSPREARIFVLLLSAEMCNY
jgi:hypothetical protein